MQPLAKRFHRRLFLRGLGGACVAAPFLGSIGGRTLRAATPAPPRRLIVMFTHYGCITTSFFPKRSHGPLTAADLEATTLKPLAPFADKLLLPRGIRAMNEWTYDLSRGQGNDQHTQVVGSYFTCQPVTPNSDNPFDFENPTAKFEAKPIGPSLDHVIARQLSPGKTPLFIRVGNAKDTSQSAISYSAAETPHVGLGSPAEVFASLTGLFNPGDPLSPDGYRLLRGKSILDVVKDDLETLERMVTSQADRQKLEAWKALLDETGTVIAAQCNAALAERLGIPVALAALANQTDSAIVDVSAKIEGVYLDVADLYSNLAVLAAACNANPVIVLKYPANYRFKGLDLNYESHSLSHRIANTSGTCVSGVLDMLVAIDDFYARKFAHLVGKLNEIDEGDGKLLDNTAAVWFQEMSDGAAHNLNNLPIVQAGSAGGYFKTGWSVNVDDGSPDLTRGNSDAACNPNEPPLSVGPVQTTGTDPSLANAPINKYFCNLMNALGVKAGPDGFPLEGGTEEVSCFGMYDRTEDFIGGGTNPPEIHDPGEFTALKANA
ncbi:MAG: DUF1552 domain-containing protein [Pseudomonadota bacterium]|nr:MAG: Tat pathway signal sequence [Pseudomonadota bacterium]